MRMRLGDSIAPLWSASYNGTLSARELNVAVKEIHSWNAD